MFACRKDWYFLPENIRDAILANYIPGQEISKNPTQEYLDAAQTAINYYQRQSS